MVDIYRDKYINELKVDCKNCFGLCCIALYFSKFEGFPINKDAGAPCINLKKDFTCAVHKNLTAKGLKGCTAYDCFGAGQKIAQVTYEGKDWRENKESSQKMFEGFLIMRQLHEMLWYLTWAFELQSDINIKDKIGLLIDETENLTLLHLDDLLKVNVEGHRDKVNQFLKNTSERIRSKANNKNKQSIRKDYFGKDLRKTDLKGADLRGAILIAANLSNVDLSFADLIGADFRDANINGANLERSIFLTQSQINSAKGDLKTKLPKRIVMPNHWEK